MLGLKFLILNTLILSSAVAAHPTPGEQAVFTPHQDTGPSKVVSDDDFPGWIDPRINGGRFLDVRPLCRHFTFSISMTTTVHDSNTRRATKCDHIREIRPIHSYGIRPTFLCEVSFTFSKLGSLHLLFVGPLDTQKNVWVCILDIFTRPTLETETGRSNNSILHDNTTSRFGGHVGRASRGVITSEHGIRMERMLIQEPGLLELPKKRSALMISTLHSKFDFV